MKALQECSNRGFQLDMELTRLTAELHTAKKIKAPKPVDIQMVTIVPKHVVLTCREGVQITRQRGSRKCLVQTKHCEKSLTGRKS